MEYGGLQMGDGFISTLLTDAASMPATVLVLDDFHAMANAEPLAEVALLIELAPPQLHFVVSARMDPVAAVPPSAAGR